MTLYFTLFIAMASLSLAASAQTKPADLLIVGSDHLDQLYKKDNPNTDVLTLKRQTEIKEFVSFVSRYKPDRVMIEVLPEKQQEIDSLYRLYVQDKLTVEQLPNGRSEIYQIAFRIGKQFDLPKIYCVNAPGGTSQGILDNGKHIELYKAEGQALRAIVNEKNTALQKNTLSLKDYLLFLNQPETIYKIYHLRYITPSRVINGTFKNPDPMVDTAFVNPRYIGAELTSVFRNRDYKIYSNIVTTQLEKRAERLLLLIGVAHIGSLKSLFRDDDEYKIIDAATVLK